MKKSNLLLLCVVCGILFYLIYEYITFEKVKSNLETNDLHIVITYEKHNLEKRSILINALITNTSSSPINLPRLKHGFIEDFGVWGGWRINISTSEGGFAFIPRRSLIKDADLIFLEPGKSFRVVADIAEAKHMDSVVSMYPLNTSSLHQVVGEIEVTLIYGLSHDAEVLHTSRKVSFGNVQSNKLIITR